MADIVPLLLSFPPDDVAQLSPKDYDREITAYLKSLTRVPNATWSKPVEKQNLYDLLNPALNSVPYLIALCESVKANVKNRQRLDILFNHAVLFFTSFDPVQVRYVGEQWLALLTWATQMIQSADVPDFSPISAAILRLDPTAGTFTTHHLDFVRTCLSAGVPTQALSILDKNVYAFPTHITKNDPTELLLSDDHELSNAFITDKSGFTAKLHPEHFLEYYLLGAHIYIGLRNYNRARLFLEYLLLSPSQQHAVSALQVEAYKKWALIGLLAEGKLYPLPRTHDPSVLKSIRAIARPYDELAEVFERRDWRKYQAEMDEGTQIWDEDGNLRLVKEAGDALPRYRVIDLQKTYAALPVSRVAYHLDFTSDATLHLLDSMIREHHLSASIAAPTTSSASSGDAVLRFHESDITSSSMSHAGEDDEELQAQTRRIEDLVTFIRDADRRLQLTKEYVEHQKRAKRHGAGPDGDLADQMDLTWDAPGPGLDNTGEEEDLMAS